MSVPSPVASGSSASKVSSRQPVPVPTSRMRSGRSRPSLARGKARAPPRSASRCRARGSSVAGERGSGGRRTRARRGCATPARARSAARAWPQPRLPARERAAARAGRDRLRADSRARRRAAGARRCPASSTPARRKCAAARRAAPSPSVAPSPRAVGASGILLHGGQLARLMLGDQRVDQLVERRRPPAPRRACAASG